MQDWMQKLQVLASDIDREPNIQVDLGYAALCLAAAQDKIISIEACQSHLRRVAEAVELTHVHMLKTGQEDSAALRLEILRRILIEDEGYHGDEDSYDDLQNASLIKTIERRKGMPITLGLLCIALGQMLGWEIKGLDIPGHFLCRIEYGGQRLIFDPFHALKIMNAADLRALVKAHNGPQAELSAAYYEPASSRMILTRLQNNIKFRQIATEDYAGAMRTTEVMKALFPGETILDLELGVLAAKTGEIFAAIRYLEMFLERADSPRDKEQALELLRSLKEQLQ